MIRLAIPSNRAQRLSKVPAFRAGQSYERRASAWLAREFGMFSQIEFEKDNSIRFIPDGLMFSFDWKKLVVVEIKTQHSRLGEQQLKNYVKWLGEWFPGPVSGLEVCGIMHPGQSVEWDMIPSPRTAFYLPFSIFAISSGSLPRMKARGLGMDNSTLTDVVPTTWSARYGVDWSVRDSSVASS